MSDRKQTPDVLADLLGGEPPAGDFLVPKAPAPPRISKRKAETPPRPARAARAQPTAPVTGWQHRVASFQQHNGWRLRYEDGVKIKDWASGPLLTEYIAALGAEGWQVTGVCSGEALFGLLDKYQVFFKRPSR